MEGKLAKRLGLTFALIELSLAGCTGAQESALQALQSTIVPLEQAGLTTSFQESAIFSEKMYEQVAGAVVKLKHECATEA